MVLKKFNNYIKSWDVFGKGVALNIGGEDSYNTWIGGFFSMIIQLMMYFYIYILIKNLATYGNDSVSYLFPDLDIETLGEVNYKKSGIMLFHEILRPFKHGDRTNLV